MSDPVSNTVKALGNLLVFYDLDVDLKGLIDDVPSADDLTSLELAALILQRLGFKIEQRTLEQGALVNAECPVLVQLNNDQSALYMPQKTHADAPQNFSPDDYEGQALYVLSPPAHTGLDTTHMRGGHALDWFWQPIVQYKERYIEILIASVFINLLVLAIPVFTLNVYDRVVINFAQETLFVLTAGVFIALLFDFLFKVLRSYILERVAEDVGAQFDFELMERFFRIKPTDINISIGEQANIFRELQGIREFYAGRLMPTLVDLPFALLFIGVIYLLSPPLALVPIGVSAVIIALNFFSHIPVSRMTEEYFGSIQNKSALLIETLAGLNTARMFNAVSARLFKWNTHVKDAARVGRQNSFMMSLMSNISMFLSQTGHILIIFFGVYQIDAGNLTIGGLIASTILAGRAVGPIVGLSGIVARLKQSNDVLKVIDKFFQAPHEDMNDVSRSAKGPYKGAIKLQKVNFQYEEQSALALENINLDIKPGDSIGLIGKTAAGKSTLAKLLANMIVQQEGSLTLDGYDYNAIPTTELRRTVAYVPQDSFFFRGSIRHNILLGRENISDETLKEAISISGLDLVIQHSAQGLDTEVGELGSKLSGGQKQAISLARAIVQQPQILIFDEPTTGMDHALENHVKQKLESYIKGKTFVMVTHRTPLLPLVDRIVLLDRGHILADGPRDEILKKLNA